MGAENRSKIQILIDFFEQNRCKQFDASEIAKQTGLKRDFVLFNSSRLLSDTQFIGTIQSIQRTDGLGQKFAFRFLAPRNEKTMYNVNNWPTPKTTVSSAV